MRTKVVVALLLLVVSLATLEAQEGGLESFGEVIDVRVLNLEVAVTDRDGQHVRDLQPEDFRLIVDGEEVSIGYFSEIRRGAAEAPPQGAVGAISSVPSVTPGEVVGTSFLLFVDNFFGHQRDRQLVLDDLIEQLPGFGPKDRMAIVAFDGRQLDLVGNWSTTPAEIAQNLRTAMELPAHGLERRAELERYELQLRSLGAGVIADSTRHIVVEYVRQLSRQVDTVVKAATTAMRTMASPPGRKVMLVMSGGWPADPSTYVAGNNSDIRNSTRLFSPKKAFGDLSGTANLLGYALYPIDLPGKTAHGGASAADRGESVAIFSAPSTTPPGPGSKSMTDPVEVAAATAAAQFQGTIDAFDKSFGRENELERTLLNLARDTGGRAMINGLRTAVLEESINDASNYYWLGYAPSWQRDDKAHKVRVEVLRPGLSTRSRRSFRDLSRQAEVTMMVESNLLFSTELSGHSLEVEMGQPTKTGRRLELPVSLKIPLDQIIMLPVASGFEARLELRVAVLDAAGNRSEIPVIPVVLGGAAQPQPGAFAIYDTSLRIRKTPQRLALALYDAVGEQILASALEFDPESI